MTGHEILLCFKTQFIILVYLWVNNLEGGAVFRFKDNEFTKYKIFQYFFENISI